MTRPWIAKLFAPAKPRTIRNTRGREQKLVFEPLEDRITPADLIYTAVGSTPLTLRLAGPNLQVVNAANPGQVLASKALAAVTTGVRIDGHGFNVNLTVDAGVPRVAGGVLFVGGPGTNTLVGPDAQTDWVLTGAGKGGAVGASGVTIQYEGVESLRGGSKADTFKVNPGGALTGGLEGGGGAADALVADDTPNVWAVAAVNQGKLNSTLAFTGIENLIGGTGNDTFVFAGGATVAGMVDGGSKATADATATDALDYSAYTTPVAVDLAAGTATGTGGAKNINRFVGGANASDTLRGPADPAVVWTVSGPNTGTVAGTAFAGFERLVGADNNSDAFVIAGPGSVSGVIDGGAGGSDGLQFVDPNDPTSSQVFNPAGADSSGTATLFSKPVPYARLDRVAFYNAADPLNPVVTGSVFNDSIRVHTDPAVAGGLTVEFRGDPGRTVTLNPLQVAQLASLRIDGIEGADTITVESLPAGFTGGLYLYGNRLQRTDPSYSKVAEDDPYPDSVVIAGDISLGYLEVFADHVTVNDNVHVATGVAGIFFRPRQIGVATFENLLPVFGTDRSVSVDIGANAVLEGGSIYFVVQAEDRSFSDVIGAGREVSNFVIDPLTDFLGSAVALPAKVLVKNSSAAITLRDGATLRSGGTIGLYATAAADASGAAFSSLVSVGYGRAVATATIDIQKNAVVDAGAAVVVTATGNATASVSASTQRELDPLFGAFLPGSPSVALAVGVADANVTSHVTVARGASIKAGKTANVTATGNVSSSASGEAGQGADGTAGLGFGIQLSHADIHTTVDGAITALALPGYTVKNEIDPLVAKADYTSGQKAYGLQTGKTVELLTGVSAALPAGTVMKYVSGPVADTVDLAATAQNYADASRWEKSTPAVGYVDYATNRVFLGSTALVTEDVINYTNRRGTSIGGLVDGRDYYLVADASEPGYFWLAETETQAVRASLGYLAHNVVPLSRQAWPPTETNDRHFAAADVDATANTVTLRREAAVNNTFELGQAVVYHAPSVSFTSGVVGDNTITVPAHGLATGDPVTYSGVGLPANTPSGQLENGATYYVLRVSDNTLRLSLTPGGPALVLSPDQSSVGRRGVVHKLTRFIDGLADGGTYYVVASTGQNNLQGNSRLTDTQVIRLAESENEARAGVFIDIGQVRGTGYTLSAKHVLDSGFATGLGVVAQLTANTTASGSAGLVSEPDDGEVSEWSKFTETVGSNVPDLLFGKLTEAFANVPGGSELGVAGALAFNFSKHVVLTDIGSTAVLKSNEDLEVKALITQNYSQAAESHLDSAGPVPDPNAPAVGVSVAAAVGLIDNTARATVHSTTTAGVRQAATLNGLRATRVISQVAYPFLTRFDEFIPLSTGELVDSLRTNGAGALTKYLTGTMGAQDAFFNSWVASTASASKVGLAASVNVLTETNDSEAVVESGVRINQDAAWHRKATNDHPNQAENQADGKGEEVVSVEATTYEQAINMTGVFSLPSLDIDADVFVSNKKWRPKFALSGPKLFGGGGGSEGGVGGSVHVSTRTNTTHAVVQDGASVTSGADGGFNIKAEEGLLVVNLVQSGASGGDYVLAGSVATTVLHSDTLAQLGAAARVTGRDARLYAGDLTTNVNWVGGVASGESLGIGFSLATNSIDRKTRAVIGDPDAAGSAAVPAARTIDVSGTVEALARVQGELWVFSIAGAVAANRDEKFAVAGVAAGSFNDITSTTLALLRSGSVAAGAGVSIDATDAARLVAVTAGGSVALSAGGGTSAAVAVGLALAHNTLDSSVAATIAGSAIDGKGVAVRASDAGTITASAVAAAVSVAAGSTGVAASGGGAESTNIILTRTNAGVAASRIGSATAPVGAVTVTASSSSAVTALVGAFAAAAGVGFGTAGVGVALGVGVARNYIGWNPAGVSASYDYDTNHAPLATLRKGTRVRVASGPLAGEVYEYVGDTLADDPATKVVERFDLKTQQFRDGRLWKPVSAAANSAQVRATLSQSSVHAAGDLTVRADDAANIDATVVAVAVGLAGGGSVGVAASGAGVYAENKIATQVQAAIDGDGLDPATEGVTAGRVVVSAGDSSGINAVAGAGALAAAFGGSTGVAAAVGLALAFNEINNDVAAAVRNADQGVTATAGGLSISATAQGRHLFDLTPGGLVTAANLDDAAAADLAAPTDPPAPNNASTRDAIGDRDILAALRAAMDAQLAGSGLARLAVSDTVAPAAMFTTGDGRRSISEGVTVKVAAGYARGGVAGQVYRYIGANAAGVDLGTQNYADATKWLRLDKLKLTVLEPGKRWTLVAPDGATFVLALTDAGKIGVGRNSINAVSVAASVAVGVGGDAGLAVSGAGAVAQNVILSRANAYAADSVLAADDINLSAVSNSMISSTVVALSAAVGGGGYAGIGASIGVAVARNFIGYTAAGSAAAPAQVQATLSNSSVRATGALVQSAIAHQSINSVVAAGSVAVGAGTAGLAASGSGVFAENKVGVDVQASIDRDRSTGTTGIAAGRAFLGAADTSSIDSVAAAVSVSLSGGIVGGSVSVGVSLARNTITSHVDAFVARADGADADSTDQGVGTGFGGLTVEADEFASIRAVAAAASVAAGFGSVGVGLSGAGADANNVILTGTRAYIQNSAVASGGFVSINATNAAVIDATILGLSVGVGGGVAGIGGSIGVALARNSIGYGSNGVRADFTTSDNPATVGRGKTIGITAGPGAGNVYQYIGTSPLSRPKAMDASGARRGNATENNNWLTRLDYSDPAQWLLVSQVRDAEAVEAYVLDSSVQTAGALTLDAVSNQSIHATVAAGSVALSGGGFGGSVSGAGAASENRIAMSVRAYVQGDRDGRGVTAASVALSARDKSTIDSFTGAASLAATVGAVGASLSIGVGVAHNEIDTGVTGFIKDVTAGVATTAGDLTVEAHESATVTSKAFAASAAVSLGGLALGLSGAGVEATNTILTVTDAYAANSVLDSARDITLAADDTAGITAETLGLSAAVAGGVGGGFGVSIGAAVTANVIGSPTYSPPVPVRDARSAVRAYFRDTAATAARDLTLTATADQTIRATVDAVSVAASAGGFAGVGLSGAGASVTNSVGADIRAFIEGTDPGRDGRGPAGVRAGSVTLTATDRSSIDAAVGAVAVGVGLGLYGAAAAVGLSTATSSVTNLVDAHAASAKLVTTSGGLTITATETATVHSAAAATAVAAGTLVAGAGAGVQVTSGVATATRAYASPVELDVAGGVRIDANAKVDAAANAKGFAAAGGLVPVSAAVTRATVNATPLVESYLGGYEGIRPLRAGGDIALGATLDSTVSARATGNSVAAGLGVAVGATAATATVRPTVTSTFSSGIFVAAGGIAARTSYNADGNGNALAGRGTTAAAEAGAGGLIASSGATAYATELPTVESAAVPKAVLQAGDRIDFTADSAATSRATAAGQAGGLVGVGRSVSNATGSGTARARMDGTVVGATSLTVAVRSADWAVANSQAVSGGLYAGTDNTATAAARPTTVAHVGGPAVTISGTLSVKAASNPEADAVTIGVGTGGIQVGSSVSSVEVQPTVVSDIGAGSRVSAYGVIVRAAATPARVSGRGDGVSTALSVGSGGAAFVGLNDNTATSVANANVTSALAAASVNAAGPVVVSADSVTNAAASASNYTTTGFIGRGNTYATTLQLSTTDAYVGPNTVVQSGADVAVNATSLHVTSGRSDAKTGGFATEAKPFATATLFYRTTAGLRDGARVLAADHVGVGADANLQVDSRSVAAGGNGAGSGAYPTTIITVDRNSQSLVSLGQNAAVTAPTAALRATTSRMAVYGEARGGASGVFGASAASASTVTVGATNKVALGGGARLTGTAGVDIAASFAGVDLFGSAFAEAYALGVTSRADSNLTSNLASSVVANRGALVTAGPRDPLSRTLAHPFDTTLGAGSLDRLALFVDTINQITRIDRSAVANGPGGSLGISTVGETRNTQSRIVDLNADVNILSGQNAVLEIAADGTITKAVNASVRTSNNANQTSGTIPNADQVFVNDIRPAGPSQVFFNNPADAGRYAGNSAVTIGGSGGTWTFSDSAGQVLITNHSNRTLRVNDIDVAGATAAPYVDLRGPVVALTFGINRATAPALVQILNDGPAAVVLNGTINNPNGATVIRNAAGLITAARGRGVAARDGLNPLLSRVSLVTTSALDLQAPASDVDANVDLVITDARPAPAVRVAGGNFVYLDLKARLRSANAAASFTAPVDSLTSGGDIYLQLQDSVQEPATGADGGVRVSTLNEAAVPYTVPTANARDGIFRTFFRLRTTPPQAAGSTAVGPATARNSVYDFRNLVAGGNVVIQDVQGAADKTVNGVAGLATPTVSVIGLSNVRDAGHVDINVDGNVTLTAAAGDLRVGMIRSRGGDVTLTSAAGSILDAAGDAGPAVVGVNVTLVASQGSIGSDANFLGIDSSNRNGAAASGLLDARSRNTVRVVETAGDLRVKRVDAAQGDVTLVTRAGSILDGRPGSGLATDAAAVLGNSIDLQANGGSIGQAGNDVEIDSSRRAAGDVGLQATGGISLTEAAGTLRLVQAGTNVAGGGDIRLTVRDSQVATSRDENFELLASGSVLFAENAPVALAFGTIRAGGSVLLQIGDDFITHDSNLISGGSITVVGDYGNADPGVGTAMDIRGRFISGGGAADRIAFFGNTDNDSFTFNHTNLLGQTFAYGSNTPTPAGTTASTRDGADTFTLNQLQSMTTSRPFDTPDHGVAFRRDTLDLDGQAGGDVYLVNTSGSQSAAPVDYIVNVLDTGARTGAANTLTVNGGGGDDQFVLRRTQNLIGRPGAATPAYVALLHGGAAPQVERVNYDTRISGGLTVNGLDGNDSFVADDTSAPSTLNGGAGDDTFQFGHLYGAGLSGVEIDPYDVMDTVRITRGNLIRGVSYATVANGGAGDDAFSVDGNRAALSLNGNDGDDRFDLRTYTLANPDGSTPVGPGPYNVNAPLAINGGNDYDIVEVLGVTRFDPITVSPTVVEGAGIKATLTEIESADY